MQRDEELCARTTKMLSKIIGKANAHNVDRYSRQNGIFSSVDPMIQVQISL